MRFEHLIQVNDINNANDFFISRAQLWEGLLLRAVEPDRFLVAIESFTLLEQQDNYLKRELKFPGSVINDEVFLEKEQKVHYKIISDKGDGGASLIMQIEEPEINALFVRFIYKVKKNDSLESELVYDSVVQQAYVNTDLETIQLIKQYFQDQ